MAPVIPEEDHWMTDQSCQQICRCRQLQKAVSFFVVIVLVMVVYVFGYASDSVVASGESAVAATLVKVSGTVIIDVVTFAFTIKTTSGSEL